MHRGSIQTVTEVQTDTAANTRKPRRAALPSPVATSLVAAHESNGSISAQGLRTDFDKDDDKFAHL